MRYRCFLLAFCLLPRLSWAALGPPLGRLWAAPEPSWEDLGASLGRSWWLLGLSWPGPGLLPASLGPSWRLLEPPLGRLGRLLAAESDFHETL